MHEEKKEADLIADNQPESGQGDQEQANQPAGEAAAGADVAPDNQATEKETPSLGDDRDKVRSGMIIRVYEKVLDVTAKGEERERMQVFKGLVLARKHGHEPGATITVRKQTDNFGVEKIFPVYSPLIARIVIDKQFKVRRNKLYFLRNSKKRLAEIK